MTIDEANSLAIRPAMTVKIDIDDAARLSDGITITNPETESWIAPAADPNFATSLRQDAWPTRRLADLSGLGIPLDGSTVLHDPTKTASQSAGKIGVYSSIGTGSATSTNTRILLNGVTADNSSGFFTIRTRGRGRLYWDPPYTTHDRYYNVEGDCLTIVRRAVGDIVLQLIPENGERIVIESIRDGIAVEIRNDNLISADLVLRSSLSVKNEQQQLGISEIQVDFYAPDSSAADYLCYLDAGTKITYSSGYDGEMSAPRSFFLAGQPESSDGHRISFTGEDQVGKLDGVTKKLDYFRTTVKSGARDLYNYMLSLLQAANVSDLEADAAPGTSGSSTTAVVCVNRGGTARQILSDIMYCKSYAFQYVDAGRPHLSTGTPTQWEIKEADCGDVKQVYAPAVKTVTADDDFGVQCEFSIESVNKAIERGLTWDQGDIINKKPAEYYHNDYSVSIGGATASPSWIAKKPDYCTFTAPAAATGNGVVYGRRLIPTITPQISDGGTGAVLYVTPVFLGIVKNGSSNIYPNYQTKLLRRKGGSFTWRGDPRMQPLDKIRIKDRKRNTYTTGTITEIALRHERGGTTATISYCYTETK